MNILVIALLAAALGAGDELKSKTQNAPRKKGDVELPGNDPIQKEYEKLLEKDEAALEEIDRLVREFEAFASQGAPGPRGVLMAKIDQVVGRVKKDYEGFLQKHPKHVEGFLAYGSFLNEIGEEEGAVTQWEKARELDPKNPSPWNNLANIFGHIGPIKKAFQYYEKAIELDPKEPVYIHNLATTTYLFRKDAAEMYRIDEKAVFDKSIDLYRQAMRLDPANLVLATDFAQGYYGINPLRVEDALAAWNHCLTLTKNDVERQGIYLHLARVKWMAGKLDEAQGNLDMVKLPEMTDLKSRLQRNIDKKRSGLAAPEKKLETSSKE